MAINLTEGAIVMLLNKEDENLKPVLQVWEIKLVSTQPMTSTSERFRVILSDGVHLQQGMLATQRNDLVKSGSVQKGSVIQLTQFICNDIQGRQIVIILDLEVILDKCDPIGKPKPYIRPKTDNAPILVARSSAPGPSSMNQQGTVTENPPYVGSSPSGGSFSKPNVPGGTIPQHHNTGYSANPSSNTSNHNLSGYNTTTAPYNYPKTEPVSGVSRVSTSGYVCPQAAYSQPPPMYTNRGPVAKNDAPPRIIPIAVLNPYQGRWTIKARVTAKAELKHYSNARGDGKVFSFDLLDSDGGEIRVTCFNAVADQFYNQIEVGKVYLISKGSLKPVQNKAFNHLRNDHEIYLESTSTVQPCSEDDKSIPQQQFHFRSIGEVEGMENNSILDTIGIVSFISPSTSIMRKNGTETLRRILHLKDMSGRSVELTLWGNFCNAEGATLQNLCDSGVFPLLAVKSCKVSEFNGKALGTIFSSQLFIEPDFPEALKLKDWFDKEGKSTTTLSISRETTTLGRTDERKTISQIKDEKLGTSEKPDWITVSATLSFMKVDNFCYTACPLMIGDRQCNKKVTNNGDGTWRCDRCDQSVDECDYRYILQFQVQDHTGLTWVTAFQECGQEIMGISAKDLYFMKHEDQDDERFGEIVRKVLFTKYIFKLKVKEETFSDEQRVKSTVQKVEKVNFSSECKFLMNLINKPKGENVGSSGPNADTTPNVGLKSSGYANVGGLQSEPATRNYMGDTTSNSYTQYGSPANQVGPYGNQYNSPRVTPSGPTASYLTCNSCGGTGHASANCPSIMTGQAQSYGGGFVNRAPSGGGGGGSGECFKCHQFGHWARDCPGLSNVPPAYGSGGSGTPGRYGGVSKQRVGGF